MGFRVLESYIIILATSLVAGTKYLTPKISREDMFILVNVQSIGLAPRQDDLAEERGGELLTINLVRKQTVKGGVGQTDPSKTCPQ